MGLFSSKTAESCDNAAARAYEVGTKLAGETGGKVADAVSNAVLAPIRRNSDEPTTNKR